MSGETSGASVGARPVRVSPRAPGEVPPNGGILPVDKPVGPTSHDVVARARRALRTRRVGHTGTLDPLASGLLLLCVGPATRLSQFLVGADKRYRTTIRLGVETDSLDAEGEVVRSDEAWRDLSDARVGEAVAALVGPAQQVPPALSAKKVRGEPAHRRVRRGEEVRLDPVPVVVHGADLVRIDLPEIEIDVRVSSGTFVRSLARDLAASLGTTGHVTALRRTAVGAVRIADAVALRELEEAAADGDGPAVIPWISPLDAIAHLPLHSVGVEEARRLAFGQRLPLRAADGASGSRAPGDLVRVEAGGRLIAVAEVEDAALRPRKVFVTPDELEPSGG